MKNKYQQRPRRSARRGFTLIEILVVVTIIAILAGLVGWRVFGALGSAKSKVAKAEASQIASAFQNYQLDTGAQPEDGFDLSILLLTPEEGGGPSGPYLDKRDALIDPWENGYFMRVPGEERFDFDIVSYGADGQPGGTGETADVAG